MPESEKTKWLAIVGITVITSVALLMGINGMVFAGGLAAVAGLGGYGIGKKSPS